LLLWAGTSILAAVLIALVVAAQCVRLFMPSPRGTVANKVKG
jgi:hypothetical protein